MAHIPYGYKIVDAKAVINEEEADRFRDFIRLYLSGLSIKSAVNASQLGASASGAKQMMKHRLYAEDDYYPPIISLDTFQLVQSEWAKRTHQGNKAAKPAVEVAKLFILAQSTRPVDNDPYAAFADLYHRIKASPTGTRTLNQTGSRTGTGERAAE